MFTRIYPEVFHSNPEIQRFRSTSNPDESPASRLPGEIPAPFPTVPGQLKMMKSIVGQKVDLALVTGGINDFDPESFINAMESHPGEFIEYYDAQIRQIAFNGVLDLLMQVRNACPNAIIVYFGFFRLFSYLSNEEDIRSLMRYVLDDDIGWYANEIFGCTDVNALIRETKIRGEWLHGRWQYWARLAVAYLNRVETLRGNGILFSPSGFGPDNAGFTSHPLLWSHYREPENDPVEKVRRSQTPRIAQLDTLWWLHINLGVDIDAGGAGGADAAVKARGVDLAVKALDDAIQGPLPLKEAIADYRNAANVGSKENLRNEVDNEIARIRHCLVASTGHPSGKGASRYADIALRRLANHAQALQRTKSESHQAAQPVQGETLDQLLRRYKLRSGGPVAADAGHLDVDSLALRVVTSQQSDQNFFPDMTLAVSTQDANGATGQRHYLLNFPYNTVADLSNPFQLPPPYWVEKLYPQFEPGATDRLTIAIDEALRLDEIVGVSLLVGGDRLAAVPTQGSYGKIWRPTRLDLEVNGHNVATITPGRGYTFNETLDLKYPASKAVTNPGLAPIEFTRVKPIRVNKETVRRRALQTPHTGLHSPPRI